MGRVFKVQNNESIQYALKVVLGDSHARMLKKEHKILKDIFSLDTHPQDRIKVFAEDYCEVNLNKTVIGAGFLMTPVGIPVNKKTQIISS